MFGRDIVRRYAFSQDVNKDILSGVKEYFFFLGESFGFLVKILDNGDLLFKPLGSKNYHYHLIIQHVGIQESCVKFKLVKTEVISKHHKKHASVFETPPLVTKDFKTWSKWLDSDENKMHTLIGEHYYKRACLATLDQLLKPGWTATPAIKEIAENQKRKDRLVISEERIVKALSKPLLEPPKYFWKGACSQFPHGAHAYLLPQKASEVSRGKVSGQPKYLIVDTRSVIETAKAFIEWFIDGAIASFKDNGVKNFFRRLKEALILTEDNLELKWDLLMGYNSGE